MRLAALLVIITLILIFPEPLIETGAVLLHLGFWLMIRIVEFFL